MFHPFTLTGMLHNRVILYLHKLVCYITELKQFTPSTLPDCVCAGCSLASCPFSPSVVISSIQWKIPFSWELPPSVEFVTPIELVAKYSQYLVHQIPIEVDLRLFQTSTRNQKFLRCMVTSPYKRKVKAVTLVIIVPKP